MLTLRPIRMIMIDTTGVAQASAQDQKEANQMTARSIIDEMMDVGAERLGGYDERGQWHQPDEPEPVNFHFIRGAKNGIILSIIIDALLLLALYGHRLALWIDGVAR